MKLLPVRHQEPLTALLRFIRRVVVSEQKIETAQGAGCDTDHCNQERNSGHGYPSARVCHPLSEDNDQKRRAPVNCSAIRTGGLGPINARTSRLGQLMIPLTCLAQAHLVNPKTGKLGSGDEWMRGVLRVYTTRAEVMRSPWPFSAFF
jgi:hypothetical protein